MPDGTGNDGTNVEPTTSAVEIPQAPTTLALPQPSSIIKREDPTVDFERQWNHLRGEVKTRQGQWDSYQGEMETYVQELRSQIGTLGQQLSLATTESTGLKEQVDGLPALKERGNKADSLEKKVAKLEFIMRFPGLVNATVAETITAEDGKETEVKRNPYLDLALSSTLKGKKFEVMVSDLAKAVGTTTTPPTTDAPPTTTGASPTGGPLPQTPTTYEELKRQREEARAGADYSLLRAINDQMLELRLKEQ